MSTLAIISNGKHLADGSILYKGEKYYWKPKELPTSKRYKIVGIHLNNDAGICSRCKYSSAYIIEDKYHYNAFEYCEKCLKFLENKIKRKIKWGAGECSLM